MQELFGRSISGTAGTQLDQKLDDTRTLLVTAAAELDAAIVAASVGRSCRENWTINSSKVAASYVRAKRRADEGANDGDKGFV